MLTLAHPWLLALLPLPLLAWWLLPAHREPRRELVVPFLPRLAQIVGQRPTRGAAAARDSLWRWLVLIACWLCALLALARPQVIEPPISRDVPARDLLLAVDLSGSMETKDFQDAQGQSVDRLTAVKSVLADFLAKRQGDRVGLIFFGDAAFVQVPFTEDLHVCRQLLDEAQVRMAGVQTAFGDAIGLAISVFERSTVKERVLIALTDGNDTASRVPPDKAAQIAKDKGIVVHTVAVGDPRAAGEDALDETTLKRVASTTGGLYSHAGDRAQLAAIYAQLDALETRVVQTISHRPRRDVYWWPLAVGLAISMSYFAIGLLARAGARRPTAQPSSAALAAGTPLGLAALPASFHLIRPEWLLALLPAALLWWALRRRADTERPWRGIIAPHLLPHLLGGEAGKTRFGPVEWIGIVWLLAIVAIAGPTWRREPSPFAGDTAALAIVVKVSPSMQTEDVQPSRLQRAAQKIHDLLKARGDAMTSLIAYSGSAHLVMPATKDGGIIDSFAQALDPKIMPVDGDDAAAALTLADQSLKDAGGGSIVWITDGVAPEQAQPLAAWRQTSDTSVRVWPPLLPGDELDSLEANARPAHARLVALAADDSDVRTIAAAAKFAYTAGNASDTQWAESGYWVAPLIAAFVLPFFRRGWTTGIG